MKENKDYYPEFHRLFKGLIIEVCEGRGIEEDPCRLVYYVHNENGELIGKLDTLTPSLIKKGGKL